jgi:RNA polymerase sigma-70 factor (ECF subfamily)
VNNTVTIQELQNRVALFEDMKAYRELYNLFFTSLHRFSYGFVKSNETAEEIVSDVFIKIWQMRGRLNEINNLKEYAYIITKNFSLNYLTKNYKNKTVSLDKIEFESVVEIKTPEDVYISADTLNCVREIINQLPPKCRIIFQLIKEDGLQYKEVASILNLSVFTVRNQLAIAVKKISEALPKNVLTGSTAYIVKSAL